MEEIEIPSYFLCPISIQLMRDPVTISTGITYDRESIEKWLFTFKKSSCPVTKQPISGRDSDHLTPNHTLRRLIQAWCTLHAAAGIERIPTPTPQLTKSHIAKLLTEAKKSSNNLLKCFHVIKSMVQTGQNNRYLENSGAVEFLAGVIRNGDVSTSEEAVSVLFNIGASECSLKKIVNNENGGEFVESITRVLNSGSFQTRVSCITLMRSVFEVADPTHLIGVKMEFFSEVVRLLKDNIATKTVLKLLMEVCPWGRNRIKAVEAGAVAALVEILIDQTIIGGGKRINELCMVVLDQLCGCAEGRAALLGHAAGVAVVGKKILRVSHETTNRAVRILSSVSRFSGNPKVLQEMMQVGIVSKLCLVLQVDVSLRTKERATEMLRVHSKVWKKSACIPHHLISSYPCS
ncbi:E3 ubiquitin-protein ligase PUB23-like [Impatiens glandulifera]|uniref:E3 ubiquitin-protein ligase PUB23-like n=1 Tax=Impatiens glandulifera TaxID=253017 RepID=UPI001FB115A1|nr:E3 ubiquitin-protein ligase PUB23-like [Impatiens glandulifera]